MAINYVLTIIINIQLYIHLLVYKLFVEFENRQLVSMKNDDNQWETVFTKRVNLCEKCWIVKIIKNRIFWNHYNVLNASKAC